MNTKPQPETPAKPRRKNCVTVELTDQQLSLATVTGQAPEAFVTAAVEAHATKINAAIAAAIKTA